MAKVKVPTDDVEAAIAAAPATWGVDEEGSDADLQASLESIGYGSAVTATATTSTTTPAPALRNYDAVQAKGRKWMDEVRALFIDTYPAFRPSYAEVTLLFACVYSISVKHDISPGQAKSLEMLRKKLFAKGVVPFGPPPAAKR